MDTQVEVIIDFIFNFDSKGLIEAIARCSIGYASPNLCSLHALCRMYPEPPISSQSLSTTLNSATSKSLANLLHEQSLSLE